jgi:hypothetical protein
MGRTVTLFYHLHDECADDNLFFLHYPRSYASYRFLDLSSLNHSSVWFCARYMTPFLQENWIYFLLTGLSVKRGFLIVVEYNQNTKVLGMYCADKNGKITESALSRSVTQLYFVLLKQYFILNINNICFKKIPYKLVGLLFIYIKYLQNLKNTFLFKFTNRSKCFLFKVF